MCNTQEAKKLRNRYMPPWSYMSRNDCLGDKEQITSKALEGETCCKQPKTNTQVSSFVAYWTGKRFSLLEITNDSSSTCSNLVYHEITSRRLPTRATSWTDTNITCACMFGYAIIQKVLERFKSVWCCGILVNDNCSSMQRVGSTGVCKTATSPSKFELLFRELMATGKKLFECLLVWSRLPEESSWKGWRGGPVGFSLLLYWFQRCASPREWVERDQLFFFAGLTLSCSLILSFCVAAPNQTVIEKHRTDQMTALQNCLSSSSGRPCFLRSLRNYILCWAIFRMESMCVSHSRS